VVINWKVLFKSILKHEIGQCGLETSGSGHGPVVGCCGYNSICGFP